ncbi:MAG: hypothetical protein HC849_15880 [Oscillatoriales cyanobacterium RU_3_3]|nr:hypothetical protein [Oscillatoriales cyanobacterium RU_3_3]NJS41897.1 hypothetical protein [Candidatus Gracilibacteria bacterium]
MLLFSIYQRRSPVGIVLNADLPIAIIDIYYWQHPHLDLRAIDNQIADLGSNSEQVKASQKMNLLARSTIPNPQPPIHNQKSKIARSAIENRKSKIAWLHFRK